MKRDAVNDDDDDEVCRAVGDAVIVLTECGPDTRGGEIFALLKCARQPRAHRERDEAWMLDHAIPAGKKPDA